MDSVLRKLQLVQLEILDIIDKICRDHHISYSLYAGTLLGAVRHHGFIPWDDDLDICMERSEYERFLEVWKNAHPDGYLLQNKDNTPSFTQSFSKIRKEHTTFLQYDWEAERYHTGIFVDIFPLDRIPQGYYQLPWYRLRVAMYLLLTREYIPAGANHVFKKIARVILRMVPEKRRSIVRTRLENQLKEYNSERSLQLIGFDTLQGVNEKYPSDMMDHFIQIQFDGQQFPCCKNWDAQLRTLYGDYMTLPPQEERTWKHHPIILNFEHDYEELMKLPK